MKSRLLAGKRLFFYSLIFCLLAGLIVYAGCRKSPKCWGKDKNKGIIVNHISDTCFFPCIASDNIMDNEYVINNDSSYQTLITYVDTNLSLCDDFHLPNIDFSEYSLLGKYASGQCNVKIIREVEKDESGNRYIYSIKVKSCGLCKSGAFSMNWVTVPKLPQDYSVVFEVTNK